MSGTNVTVNPTLLPFLFEFSEQLFRTFRIKCLQQLAPEATHASGADAEQGPLCFASQNEAAAQEAASTGCAREAASGHEGA